MKSLNKPPKWLLAVAILVFSGWIHLCACASTERAEQLYAQAQQEHKAALSLHDKKGRAEKLHSCIQLLQQALQEDDAGRISDKCIYMIAQSYHRLYDDSHRPKDCTGALENYRRVVEKYPASSLADDAQYLIGILWMREDPSQAYLEFAKVGVLFPDGDMKAKAAAKMAELSKGAKGRGKDDQSPAPSVASRPVGRSKSARTRKADSTGESFPSLIRLDKIQHWSGSDYTRVALYTDAPVSYEQHAVSANPKTQQAAKIYLDLKDCQISPKIGEKIRVMDTILQSIHVERKEGGRAQIVLESGSIERYRVFSLSDPCRLIVDVKGKNSPQEEVCPAPPPRSAPADAPSLARQLCLGVKKIVLDPGHGGKDKGATSPHNIFEKDITLAVAKELKAVLEAEIGCEVVLTRTRDRYLSLEERTAIANAQRADLFVSIHTNANENRSLHGTETYFLNLSKDKESARVAAFENATSTKKLSDLETILHDLMLNTKINESARLAGQVQSQLVGKLQAQYDGIRDLGIKQAPFYVLLGAEMPSILIETAFITNPREERLLKDRKFQENLARAIAGGIESYIQRMKGLAKAGDRS